MKILQLYNRRNRHGRIKDILTTHGHKNTAWFFSTDLCFYTVKLTNIVIISVLFFFLCSVTLVWGKTFRIATYNVENLFDLVRNNTEYPEYCPYGGYGWNRHIANIKYRNIARVIKDLGADVVALQEVESKRALTVLRKHLIKIGVTYPWFAIASSKPTPVKCAVLSMFPIIKKEEIRVDDFAARNILEVTLDIEGHPLVLFVNHWKSKSGPESMRIVYAKALRRAIHRLNRDSDFIVLGDFNSNYNEFKTFKYSRKLNDTHGITGINHILGTIKGSKLVNERVLIGQTANRYMYNLWLELSRPDRWSYLFFRHRETPDNIIVPRGLYDNRGISYVDNSFNKFQPRYLFRGKNIFRWQRADRGTGRHLGKGYSDHLPIYAYFSTEPFRFRQEKENRKDPGLLKCRYDINTASREDLVSIDGIGTVLATRIIDRRPYKTVDDLLRVKGIGPATLKKIRPYIFVGSSCL